MNLVPLRAAVIAGTCAVALSFVAVSAFADTPTDDPSGTSTSSPTSSDSTGTDAGTEDPTTDSSTDTPTPAVSDDSSEDVSDDSSDDAGESSGVTDLLPNEAGHPRLHVGHGNVDLRDFLSHGVRVALTGLTPGYSYQPFYGTANSGDVIGKPRTADSHGQIGFTWKPDRSRTGFSKPGEYTLGLAGTQTSLMITTTIVVKRDSDLVWLPAKRTGHTVTLSVSADHAPASGGKDVKWKKVKVDFQKKVGSTWVTVTTAKTNDHGVAKATFVSGKQIWRAVIDATAAVFGSTTKAHTK